MCALAVGKTLGPGERGPGEAHVHRSGGGGAATVALGRLLGGIALRAGFPLAVGIAVQIADGALAREGFLYYVLMFYLATLGVQTYLYVPRKAPARPTDRRPDNESG